MKYMNKSIEELHELLKEGKVTERELIDESLELSPKSLISLIKSIVLEINLFSSYLSLGANETTILSNFLVIE